MADLHKKLLHRVFGGAGIYCHCCNPSRNAPKNRKRTFTQKIRAMLKVKQLQEIKNIENDKVS